jgi:hypothetical protein
MTAPLRTQRGASSKVEYNSSTVVLLEVSLQFRDGETDTLTECGDRRNVLDASSEVKT